jgi:hypothetical protein
MELSEQPLAVKNVVQFGLLWPSVVVHEHWPVGETLSFQDNHILGTTAFGDGGVTVWGCFSFDCKLDLYVLDGNLTGQKRSPCANSPPQMIM